MSNDTKNEVATPAFIGPVATKKKDEHKDDVQPTCGPGCCIQHDHSMHAAVEVN